jgi:transposase-like protein
MLERLNEEIKRRTHVVRIFPNAESCLRLIRALCVETGRVTKTERLPPSAFFTPVFG